MKTQIDIITENAEYSAFVNNGGSYFLAYEKAETSLGEGISSKWSDEINRHFKNKSELENHIGLFDAYTPFEGKHLPEYSSN